MLKREEATEIGGKIVEMLAPVCNRIEIAGSIRRRKERVKDIEIVCQPLVGRDSLFAECAAKADGKPNVLDRLLSRVCSATGPLQFDPELKRNGQRYKRLEWDGRVKVDLFIVLPPASSGESQTRARAAEAGRPRDETGEI